MRRRIIWNMLIIVLLMFWGVAAMRWVDRLAHPPVKPVADPPAAKRPADEKKAALTGGGSGIASGGGSVDSGSVGGGSGACFPVGAPCTAVDSSGSDVMVYSSGWYIDGSASQRSVDEQEARREKLYWALRSRVLSGAEMNEVEQWGPSLAMLTYGFSDQAAREEADRAFDAALFTQFRLRQAASAASATRAASAPRAPADPVIHDECIVNPFVTDNGDCIGDLPMLPSPAKELR